MQNKIYYKKIFDELIPGSKKTNSLSFSASVNLDLFFKNLKLIDIEKYKILERKKCKLSEVERLIGEYIIEAFFLSKKIRNRLIDYEKKNFKIENYKKNQLDLINNLRRK